MKIAFDLRRMANPGIGRYMKCLVEAILAQKSDHEYLLLLPPGSDDIIQGNAAKLTRMTPRASYYSVREQIEIPRILRQHKVDLLHSPHFLLPLARTCPAIATIHDVIYLACPQDLPSRLGRMYYRAMMHASAKLARKIITVSAFSKSEIVRYLGIDPEKVDVIYHGVDRAFRPLSDRKFISTTLAKHRIDREFIFYAGICKPRKNHAGLLRAFKSFLENGGDAQLVSAGPLDDGEHHLRSIAEGLGIADRVIFTGFIDDDELCALYTAAQVYACPSLYEGFGFTVLEAMACGTAVVCSNATSLPEVAGSAARYADATDPNAFGEALYEVFATEAVRRQLAEQARGNLRRFSWETAANKCLDVYNEAIGNARGEVVAVG